LYLVDILFLHINDDARSKSHQTNACLLPVFLIICLMYRHHSNHCRIIHGKRDMSVSVQNVSWP